MPEAVDLTIINAKIYTNGSLYDGGLAVNEGKVVAICRQDFLPRAKEVLNAKGKYVLPGTIDTHVHFRDPGRSERETFKSGTFAAAAGGVTTVLEHPISKPPPYSPEILHNRIRVAEPQSVVDFAFFGAASAKFPEEIARVSQEGIVAFKTFLHQAPEGREEEFIGLTMDNDGELLDGLKEVAKTGHICAVHAENNDIIQRKINYLRSIGRVDSLAHAESRPPLSEVETVSKVLQFAKETSARIDFCHISTPGAMELVKRAKYDGQDVYLETCPHYLFLSEDTLIEHGPFAKCNPPLRKKELVEKLWDYITDGSVDFIGSDHSPFLLSEKETGYQDIFAAPAGFPGIDMRLPLMLNAVNEGRLSLKRAVELLTENPARIFNLFPRKGVIQVGSDADLVIVDMDATFTVSRDDMYSKARDVARVYEGWELKGKPEYTIVRGRVVMKKGRVDEAAQGWGKLIKP